MVSWQSRRHLEDHFLSHGVEVGADTIEAYDASAQATLRRGEVVFAYDDLKTGLPRVGSYDPSTRLFVALNEYDEIVSHFRTNAAYIRFLLGRSN